MQLSFGSGAVWGERTDVTGSGIGPRQFGVLQDIQIDFDLSLPTKLDDWMIHELDFSAFADSSGTIGYLSTVE